MKLSPEQIAALSRPRAVVPACPCCSFQRFTPAPEAQRMCGITVVALTCNGCGVTLQFSAAHLGVEVANGGAS